MVKTVKRLRDKASDEPVSEQFTPKKLRLG